MPWAELDSDTEGPVCSSWGLGCMTDSSCTNSEVTELKEFGFRDSAGLGLLMPDGLSCLSRSLDGDLVVGGGLLAAELLNRTLCLSFLIAEYVGDDGDGTRSSWPA